MARRQAQINVNMPQADLDRAQAAYWNLPAEARPASWSRFCRDAIMKATRAAERKHNAGRRYDSLPDGTLTRVPRKDTPP